MLKLENKAVAEMLVGVYRSVYAWLYDNDRKHEIVNKLMPLYEVSIDKNKEAVRGFQDCISKGIMSDREYAAAFATMCLYDGFSQVLASVTETDKTIEELLDKAIDYESEGE